jgi:hypothetical protein
VTFLEAGPGDDVGFLGYVEAVVDRVAALRVPGIYVTRIDGWFGERWVGFSGKTLGMAGVHHREDFNIPPFVPSRVVSSTFLKSSLGGYTPATAPVQLHISQRSESNLRRKLVALAPSDALVWFSSESRRDGRGSVLAYVPTGETHEPWFLELVREDDWRIVKSLGVSREELSVARRA